MTYLGDSPTVRVVIVMGQLSHHGCAVPSQPQEHAYEVPNKLTLTQLFAVHSTHEQIHFSVVGALVARAAWQVADHEGECRIIW